MIPKLDEAKKYQNEYKTIPICKTLYSDVHTPVEVMRILKGISKNCFLLESLEDSSRWGRYTFIGYDPVLEITCANGEVSIKNGETQKIKTANPSQYIQKIIDENKSPRFANLPPFTGGLVGYFSYDYIKYSEPTLKLDAKDEENFRDFDLMLFDKLIAYDNLKQQIVLIVNVKTEALEENYNKAEKELEEMAKIVTKGKPAEIKHLCLKSDFKALFSKEEYCDMVEKARNFIYEGDIFQVVLSNRFEVLAEGSLFDTYRVLRTTNPSPYMFFFSSDDIEIAGASPETLVKLVDGKLYSYPCRYKAKVKLTRRINNLKLSYCPDPKEISEHNMTVDLGKRDFG
jgi:anthranilate synthase component 1